MRLDALDKLQEQRSKQPIRSSFLSPTTLQNLHKVCRLSTMNCGVASINSWWYKIGPNEEVDNTKINILIKVNLVVVLPDPFRRMGAWRNSMETQQLGQYLRYFQRRRTIYELVEELWNIDPISWMSKKSVRIFKPYFSCQRDNFKQIYTKFLFRGLISIIYLFEWSRLLMFSNTINCIGSIKSFSVVSDIFLCSSSGRACVW